MFILHKIKDVEAAVIKSVKKNVLGDEVVRVS